MSCVSFSVMILVNDEIVFEVSILLSWQWKRFKSNMIQILTSWCAGISHTETRSLSGAKIVDCILNPLKSRLFPPRKKRIVITGQMAFWNLEICECSSADRYDTDPTSSQIFFTIESPSVAVRTLVADKIGGPNRYYSRWEFIELAASSISVSALYKAKLAGPSLL